jgi:hypothetical protein
MNDASSTTNGDLAMWTKVFLMTITVTAALMTSSQTIWAADETHEGRVTSVGEGKITVFDKRDSENDTFIVNAQTKILRNGKPAKLSDVQPGDNAKVTAVADGDKLIANEITATAPE